MKYKRRKRKPGITKSDETVIMLQYKKDQYSPFCGCEYCWTWQMWAGLQTMQANQHQKGCPNGLGI